jgi:WD40 repeat protein
VHQAAFAPDGLTIASSGSEGGAALWDVATGTVIRYLGERSMFTTVFALAFTPDGLLITGSISGLIHTFDPAEGTQLNEVEGPDAVYALAISPDGKTAAASTGFNGRISLWDPVSGQALGTLAGQDGMTRSLAFDADGKLLAAGGTNGRVVLWDVTRRELHSSIVEGQQPVRGLAISPDGARLAYATDADGIITYNLLNPDQLGITIAGHNSLPAGLAISDDSSRLLVYGGPGMNWRWDWREGPISPIPASDVISGIDFGPTRDVVIGADTPSGQDAVLTVWDYAAGTAIPIAAVSGLITLETSPDDTWVVVSAGESLRVWALADLVAGSIEPFWSISAPLYLAATFSPDSQQIAVAVPDRVQVIDIATQAVVMEFPWSGDQFVGDLAWSPDGRMLAVSYLSMITIYDTATGSVIAERAGDSRFGSALAFSPDSTLLVLGNDAYQIEVHETLSWDQLAILEGHMGSIIDLEISADSQIIVSASIDGTVRLWGVPQG